MPPKNVKVQIQAFENKRPFDKIEIRERRESANLVENPPIQLQKASQVTVDSDFLKTGYQ